MAGIYTRSNETDSYTILNSYNESITSSALEVAIAQSLVEAQTINQGTYISPVNNTSWDVEDLSTNYVNTSAISNYPAGSVTEYSVISTTLHSPDVSYNTYTTNISSSACANNTSNFANLNTSAPYYDSNYVVTQSLVANLAQNVSGNNVTGLFDVDASNAKIQYAMQSRWNTTPGPYTDLTTVGGDPTAITQLTAFNTNNAFAQQGTDSSPSNYQSYYASVDATDGSIDFTLVDASYQPVNNNFLVNVRDLSGVTLNIENDVGIFRIQNLDSVINTDVALNGGSFGTITTDDLNNMPMFNVGGGITASSTKTSLPIPGAMNSSQFETLLDQNVLDIVVDGWTFEIDVSSNNGGYNVEYPQDPSGIPILVSNLDNSNILDNPYYMENYVSQTHSINFSNATVVVDVSTNASTADLASINVDLTDGETLLNGDAGVNGQIILDTNTPITRVTDLSNVNVSATTIPYVYYASDLNPNTSGIDIDEMTTQNFQVMWQKVAQQSSTESSDNYLLSSNNSILTLYSGGIVDNCYNAVDFDFSFNNTLFNNQDVNVWKLNASNNVIFNSQSFYNDPSYTILETGIAVSGAITNLTETLTYNSYRILLTSKVKEELGLNTAVTDVSGWSLNYSNVGDTILKTNNTNAYASVTNVPVYSSGTISNINNGSNLSFSYVYNTINVANRPGGLSDYIAVSYTVDSSLVEFTIPQSEITRVYTSSDVSYSVVPDASYNYSGNIFNKQNWELIQVNANSVYNATFPAKYGPYDNLNLTLTNILQTDNYYAIRNKVLGHFAPMSALAFIAAAEGESIPDLQNVYETINPSPGNSLSISGIFTANDLKPFTSVVQGENTDSIWSSLSNPLQTDVYYGLVNSANLVNGSSVLGILECSIEYTPFSESTQQSTVVDLTQENYYIPFVYTPDNANYRLESFNSTPSLLASTIYTNLGSSSFIDNVNYLTVENDYSSINGWQTNTYNLTVTHDLSNTIFTVKTADLSSTVFTITTKDNTVFLGNFVVSYIPNDVYRAERVLGTSYEENFYSENYNSQSINLDTYVPGVLIQSPSNMLTDVSARPSNGSYQSFRVLGDFMTIDEVSPTVPVPTSANELGLSSYNSGSLVFQYDSSDNYSAVFTFAKYRGYNSFNGDQYFTIVRDSTVVTFDVSANGLLTALQDTLTTNMYYNQNFVVDNLRDASNKLIANLNIGGFFPYSLPPTGSVLSFIVNVTGDTLNVSISNPNYIGDASNVIVPSGATPVVDPKLYFDSMTLKDFGQDNMYTFSGLWYSNSNLMSIRPSRVKLQNSAYNNTSLSYRIQFSTAGTNLYKATNDGFNWLGNPALHGDQNPINLPNTSHWNLIASFSNAEMYSTGINIGRKTILQNPSLAILTSISYIISVPPYYKFEQISTENCPVIPYDYNNGEGDYASNITYRYMPYININSGALDVSFNPFATTQSYPDINASVTTVTTDADYLNNIKFTLTSAPSIDAALNIPDGTRYGLIVPGTNISVSLYVGLYNSTNTGSHSNPIWDAPVTSIPTTANVQSNSLILRSRDASGALYFSAIQYPADIGYPSGNQGYQQIFDTSNQSVWYNIDFKIDNTAWFNNNSPVTYFNTDTVGTRPTLYTVVDVNDVSTQVNKRRVYKYTTEASYDLDASSSLLNGIQTFNFSFDSRSYADFDISANNTFTSNINSIWNYDNLLDNTIIPNTPITWTTDSSYGGLTHVAFTFGNSTTSQNMIFDLFHVDNTQKKWSFIHLEPFQKYVNQFGLSVGSVAWDGSVTAPLTTTRVVQLAPLLTQPNLNNNTYATQQYSESTLN